MANYSKGKIAIPAVTGNIVINITAVASAPAYTNLANTTESSDPTNMRDWAWKTGYRITSSGYGAQSGKTISNAIKVQAGDVIRIKGVTITKSTDRYAFVGSTSGNSLQYYSSTTNLTYAVSGDLHTITINSLPNHTGDCYISFAFDTPADKTQVVITKNEPIV
ncbi:MAG: hypothetical protein MJ192_04810 [Clostridia bacterium]|nr:hypothetical protein [Clostridia bacterium]